MTAAFFKLTVSDIREEIGGDATSVILTVPEEANDQFQWQAGQHLPLRFMIDGQEHRRCYTISNPPGENLRITVKRTKGGVVSNYVADRLAVGDIVESQRPDGRFVLEPGIVETAHALLLWRGQWYHPTICDDQCSTD